MRLAISSIILIVQPLTLVRGEIAGGQLPLIPSAPHPHKGDTVTHYLVSGCVPSAYEAGPSQPPLSW